MNIQNCHNPINQTAASHPAAELWGMLSLCASFLATLLCMIRASIGDKFISIKAFQNLMIKEMVILSLLLASIAPIGCYNDLQTADANSQYKAASPTAGYHLSGINPHVIYRLTEKHSHFRIQVDNEATSKEVKLNIASCTSGDNTAAEMQAKIQALGGAYAAVTVQWIDNRLKIISGTTGATSKVRITDGGEKDISHHLLIGTANGGENFDGRDSASA